MYFHKISQPKGLLLTSFTKICLELHLLLLLLLLLSHFSRVRLCATPETAAHQAPPSLGFSRQEHWSGLPFPSPMHESEKWKGSRSVVSDSSRPHGLQPTRPPCPSPTPGVYPNSCPSSRWCHPTISSSVSPSPPALNLSQHQSLFQWVSSSHQVAKVLEFQLQH